MAGKQPKTPEAQKKRASKGYRRYLRRQKQAAAKAIGARVDRVTGKPV